MAESGPYVPRQQIPRRYLRRVPSFASLKSRDLDRVQRQFQPRRYVAGETILRRGVRGGFFGVVASGQVGVTFQTPGGRHLTTTLRPGDFLNPHDGTLSSATVHALTPVTLWVLPPSEATWPDRQPSLIPITHTAPMGWPAAFRDVWRQGKRLAGLGLVLAIVLLAWAALTSPGGRAFAADVQYGYGCLCLEQGKPDAAVQAFEAALGTNPLHASSYNALGFIYYHQGRLEDALDLLERAARLAPDSDVAQNNLGLILGYRGETGEALDHLRRAADLSHNVPQVYVNLGSLYLAEEDWLNAGRAYREALRLNPELALTQYNLGMAYYRQRQQANARSMFERAAQVDPDLQAAYVGLGVIAYEQGQLAEAQGALQRAVELNSYDAIAHYYLGLVYKTLDQRGQAIEAFERAVGLTSDLVVRRQAEWYLRELWGMP